MQLQQRPQQTPCEVLELRSPSWIEATVQGLSIPTSSGHGVQAARGEQGSSFWLRAVPGEGVECEAASRQLSQQWRE